MQQLELLSEEFYNKLGITFTDEQYNFLNTNKNNTLLFVRNIKNINTIKFVKSRDIRLNYLMLLSICIFFSIPFFIDDMFLILKCLWSLTALPFLYYSLRYKKYQYKIIMITSGSDLIKVEVDAIFKEEAKQIVSMIKSRMPKLETKLRYIK